MLIKKFVQQKTLIGSTKWEIGKETKKNVHFFLLKFRCWNRTDFTVQRAYYRSENNPNEVKVVNLKKNV